LNTAVLSRTRARGWALVAIETSARLLAVAGASGWAWPGTGDMARGIDPAARVHTHAWAWASAYQATRVRSGSRPRRPSARRRHH